MKNQLCALVAATAAAGSAVFGQSVVINEFRNTTPDQVELLVITDGLDMRGMILKDFSNGGTNDGGGSYTFTTDALWQSVRSGTMIVLREDGSAADNTVGGTDYNLDIGLTNATYFTAGSGLFDIATEDIVMIKAAGSANAGVSGSIHALATALASTGTFENITSEKLRASSGNSAASEAVEAQNSTAALADYNGTDALGDRNPGSIGSANTASNLAYITSLRGGVIPTNTPPMLQTGGNKTFTNSTAVAFDVVALDLIDNDTIVLSASGLPAGAVFATVTNVSAVTNTFTWNPVGPVGVYTAEFFAADNDGTTVATSIYTVVSPPMTITNDPAVWINEIHYDNTNADVNEEIEIAGPAGTDLGSFALLLYNGSGGAVYASNALSGVIDDESCGFGALSFPISGIQNGPPDGIALVKDGAQVLQLLSYEGAFVAANGAAQGIASVDIGVSEVGSEDVGLSLQLQGAGTNYNQFTWAPPTNVASMGSLNADQTISPCGGGGDTDTDGMDDTWETAFFTNLTVATATSDFDQDGFIDVHEFLENSLPNDSNSLLKATAVANSANGVVVTWQSHTGRTYVVSRSEDLIAGFTGVASNIAATPMANTWTDQVPSGAKAYRVQLQ